MLDGISLSNTEKKVSYEAGYTVSTHEACAESTDTNVLNVYNIFNLQKRHCEWIACT